MLPTSSEVDSVLRNERFHLCHQENDDGVENLVDDTILSRFGWSCWLLGWCVGVLMVLANAASYMFLVRENDIHLSSNPSEDLSVIFRGVQFQMVLWYGIAWRIVTMAAAIVVSFTITSMLALIGELVKGDTMPFQESLRTNYWLGMAWGTSFGSVVSSYALYGVEPFMASWYFWCHFFVVVWLLNWCISSRLFGRSQTKSYPFSDHNDGNGRIMVV